MDQWTDEIKKVIKAGIGAVATGVEKTQDAIETLAQKGEPLYQQAKSAVCDTADKIKMAVNESGIPDALAGRPRVDCLIRALQQLTQEELDQLRAALEEIYPTRPANRAAEEAAKRQAAEAQNAPAEEAPVQEHPAEDAADAPEENAQPADAPKDFRENQ